MYWVSTTRKSLSMLTFLAGFPSVRLSKSSFFDRTLSKFQLQEKKDDRIALLRNHATALRD